MQNWIGIAIWIIMGASIGLLMRALISRPEEQRGHAQVIAVLGAFAAVIGGMLGVGTLHLYDPMAISVGGMAGAAIFSVLMTFIYRWGLRTLI
jgi:NhaP-type Na+/H+ or K+/H+ antiporter